jgi:ABC-type nitrate/sulfonate/bicarbonate transport system, permease component
VASRPKLSRRERWVLGTAGVVLVFVAWELATALGALDPMFASSPTRITKKIGDLLADGTLVEASLSSARLFAVGFLIALVLGVTIGIILGWYRRARAIFDPWVSILYAAPRIAFIPLIIVWSGAGFRTQVIMVILTAAFPILVNVMVGVDTIDRQLMRVAQSFNATNFDVLRTVALPGAVPFIVSGIRQGMMVGLIGTVVAEYFIGITGIGGMIFNAGLLLDTSTALVGALIFAAAAVVLNALLEMLQARVERWRA